MTGLIGFSTGRGDKKHFKSTLPYFMVSTRAEKHRLETILYDGDGTVALTENVENAKVIRHTHTRFYHSMTTYLRRSAIRWNGDGVP